MIIRNLRGKRPGVTIVETALVMIPITIFFFGIFEFGLLLMNINLVNNAAREGCRYALANNTSATIDTDVQTTVNNYMAGESTNFNAFTITVSGTHQGVSYTGTGVNNLVAGDRISVTVSGQYRFMNIMPFVQMPATAPVSSSVTMVCEGAT